MVASLGLNLSAQQHNYTYRHIDERATEQMLEELPARDFQVRTKPTRVLPTKQHLLGYIGRHWTDGVYCFVSLYFEDKRTIEFMQSWPNDLSRHEKAVDKFKVAGNAVTVKDKKAAPPSAPVHSRKPASSSCVYPRSPQGTACGRLPPPLSSPLCSLFLISCPLSSLYPFSFEGP